jgi:hypothetical protein
VPHVPKHKTKSLSVAFLIQHLSGRKLVGDPGIRKDYNSYASSIANYIPTTGYEIPKMWSKSWKRREPRGGD